MLQGKGGSRKNSRVGDTPKSSSTGGLVQTCGNDKYTHIICMYVYNVFVIGCACVCACVYFVFNNMWYVDCRYSKVASRAALDLICRLGVVFDID